MSLDSVQDPVGLAPVVDALAARLTAFAANPTGGAAVLSGPPERGADAAISAALAAAAAEATLPTILRLNCAALPSSPKALVEAMEAWGAECGADADTVRTLGDTIGEILDDTNALPFVWALLAKAAVTDPAIAAPILAQRENGTLPLATLTGWFDTLPASLTREAPALLVLDSVDRLSTGELIRLVSLTLTPATTPHPLFTTLSLDPSRLGTESDSALLRIMQAADDTKPLHLPLPPLTAESLAATMTDLTPETAATLATLAAGDAAAVHTMRAEAETDQQLKPVAGGKLGAQKGAFDLDLPPRLEAAGSDLELPVATRCLRIAAMLGDSFVDETAAQALWMLGERLGEDRQAHLDGVIDLLDEMELEFEDLGFLDGGELHSHRFRRTWFRRALLVDLPEEERALLYRAAGIATDQVHGKHPNAWSWEVYRLFRSAGTTAADGWAKGLRDSMLALPSPQTRNWELGVIRHAEFAAREPSDFARWAVSMLRRGAKMYTAEAAALLVEQAVEAAVAAHDQAAQCELLLAKAGLRQSAGKPQEAFDLTQSALEVAQSNSEVPKLLQANAMNMLAMLAWQRRDQQGTRGNLERAIAIAEEAHPNHPETSGLLFNLANILRQMNEPEGSEKAYLHALAIKEATTGDAPETAAILNALGGLLVQMNRTNEAEATFRRAVKMLERHRGDHPETGLALENLGILLGRRGDVKSAERYLLEALTMHTRLFGEHPTTANTLQNLGALHFNHNDFTGAEPYTRNALGMLLKVAPQTPQAAQYMVNLSAVLKELGNDEQAEVWAKRGHALMEGLKAQKGPQAVDADRGKMEKIAEATRRKK